MYQTKNDVLDHTRADVLALLNAWLVDSINLMQQAKHAYWKVQEITCTALYPLFDEIVDAAEGSLDLLAEVADVLRCRARRMTQHPEYPHERPVTLYRWVELDSQDERGGCSLKSRPQHRVDGAYAVPR